MLQADFELHAAMARLSKAQHCLVAVAFLLGRPYAALGERLRVLLGVVKRIARRFPQLFHDSLVGAA